MKVIALKSFVSPVYGNVDGGQHLDVDDRTARNWERHKLAALAESADAVNPSGLGGDAGPDDALSASPVAPVSAPKTAKLSRKRGAKAAAGSSPSTTTGDE